MTKNNSPSSNDCRRLPAVSELIGGKPIADTYTAYADGSSLHNPGPAGWAALIIRPDGSRELLAGSEIHATNNVMELRAAIEALKALPEDAYGVLHCDSEYVVKGVTEWRTGWEARRWRNSKGQPVANADYWKALYGLADTHPNIQFQWVRGHSGDKCNELVDLLARTEAEKVRAGMPPIQLQRLTDEEDVRQLLPLGSGNLPSLSAEAA